MPSNPISLPSPADADPVPLGGLCGLAVHQRPAPAGDRLDDVVVAGAAAEIALEPLADLLLGEAVGMLLHEVDGAHHHARRAEAALQGVMFAEGISCIGCSVPSASARPSIVVTCAPSACSASMVQDLTTSPSTCTTQAPHWLVSQPTWVPVRRSFSRSSSTSSVRPRPRPLGGAVHRQCDLRHPASPPVAAAEGRGSAAKVASPSGFRQAPPHGPSGRQARPRSALPGPRDGDQPLAAAGRPGTQQPEHQRTERPEYPDRPERHGAEHPGAGRDLGVRAGHEGPDRGTGAEARPAA